MKTKLLVLFILFIFRADLESAIVMQPYLMGVQSNSIWVLTECSTTDTVYIDFGTTPSYGSVARTMITSASTGGTYVHKVYLPGLQENTVYYYRARQLASTSAGFSFITAPASDQTPFRFLWIGDYRSGTAVHDQICALVPAYNPRFYLNGGDIAITGAYNDFKNEFFRAGELNLISNIPYFLTTGNHETWGTNTMAFTKGITVQSGTEDYYSFDYGNMHVLVLNFMVNYAVGSPQYNFAMTDLSSTNKTWKLVISHAPGYCSGGHGEDAGMKTLATNIFEPKHVDMVLSGHSHFYQHNRVNGIEHMVLGGGGAPLYVPVNASYTLKSVQDYNFGVVDVTSNYFLLKVYNNYNVLLDTVRMIKNTLGISEQSTTARDFSIDEVYPNPSNPEFNVSFDIKTAAAYKLELFDITGRLVEVVKNQKFTPGHYEYSLKTEKFTSGVYFLMLSGAKDFISRKVVVVK